MASNLYLVIIYKRSFAPRAAYADCYACSGRKNSVKRTKKGPCLIVSAKWRLENAKSPAAMLQKNNCRVARCMEGTQGSLLAWRAASLLLGRLLLLY